MRRVTHTLNLFSGLWFLLAAFVLSASGSVCGATGEAVQATQKCPFIAFTGKLAAKKTALIQKLRQSLAESGPCPTRDALAKEFTLDPGTVQRCTEEALSPEEMEAWQQRATPAKGKKPLRKPDKRAVAVARVRHHLAVESSGPVTGVEVLARELSVDDGTIRRWLRAELTADEYARWQKSPKRRPSRKPDDRAAVLARAQEYLSNPDLDQVPYLSRENIADELGVFRTTVGSWLQEDLSPEELERWAKRETAYKIGRANEVRRERHDNAAQSLALDVRRELQMAAEDADFHLSTNGELAEKQGVTPRQITVRLSEALTPSEIADREARLQRQGQTNSVADLAEARRLRHEQIRRRIQNEYRQILNGKREYFSTNDELGVMFESSATDVDKAVKHLPLRLQRRRAELANVRVHEIKSAHQAERRKRISDFVKDEMRRFHAGEITDFSSYPDLNNRFGGSPSFISLIIRDSLSAEDVALRARHLRKNGREHYRNIEEELIGQVRKEVADARIDPKALMSTSEELAEQNGIMDSTVRRWLRNALSEEDQALRNDRVAAEQRRRAHERLREGLLGVPWEGVTYDSMAEAVTSEILSRHVEGFIPVDGDSVHVTVGRLEYDFKIGNMLLEFHPIVLVYPRGDFSSEEEYGQFYNEAMEFQPDERKVYRALVAEDLERRYTAKRNDNPALQSGVPPLEVVVVTSVERLYRFLARPEIPKTSPLPPLETFRTEFGRIERQVKEARDRARQSVTPP